MKDAGSFVTRDPAWAYGARVYPAAIPASSEGLLAAVIGMDVETANIPDSLGRLEGGMCQFASLVMTGLEALEIRV